MNIALMFAQDSLSAGNAVAVVGTVIAAMGATITALFAYLSSRDKLRYDAELSALRIAVKRLEDDHKGCMTAQKELRECLDRAQEVADRAEVKAARLEGQYVSAEREVADLRQEVGELRDRLYKRDKQP